MVAVSGLYWTAEYGEIGDRLQFRVGTNGASSSDAYFPISQLADLISVLSNVNSLNIGLLSYGTDLQARKADAGYRVDVVLEPRSDQYPSQIMRFGLATLSDLISTLSGLQAVIGQAFPADWDDTKPYRITYANLPDGLSPQALNTEFGAPAVAESPEIAAKIGALAVKRGELVVSVKDFGALGDGVTDDGPAIRSALSTAALLNATTVRIPRGTYYVKLSSALTPPAGITVRGDGMDQTILLVDAPSAGTYAEAFNFANDRVTLEHLTIRRASDFPCVLLPVGSVSRPRMHRVRLDGQKSAYPVNYCHGFHVGRSNTGITRELVVTECVFTGLVYGLFQTNASTATISGMHFRDCDFYGNYGTDLEFNTPAGTTTRVRVENCAFSNNLTTAAGAGFAVGLAHIVDAVVSGCTISGYNNEAIHIEDYSTDVLVEANTIATSGLMQGSVIQIISGCSRVKVRSNSISTQGNTNSIYAVNVLAGGTGTTPGGRPVIPPAFVTIADNEITCGGTTRGIYLESTSFCKVDGNKFRGPGSVSGGSFGGAFSYAMNLYASASVTVTNNTVNGFTYGVFPRNDSIPGVGDGSTLVGNMFTNCLLGLGLTGTGGVVAAANIFRQCVYSLILGQAAAAQGSVVVTGNSAVGCTNSMQIYGTANVKATAAVTTGSGKTVQVSALPNVLPVGTVIKFSGGGALTLTAVAGFQATSVTGTLATANVASGETGIAYPPYSSDATRNRTLASNSDDAQGASGFGTRVVSITADYAAQGHEQLIVCTAAVTVTLPPAANHRGQSIGPVKNASSGSVTVAAVAGNVEAASSNVIPVMGSARFTSDGINWWVA